MEENKQRKINTVRTHSLKYKIRSYPRVHRPHYTKTANPITGTLVGKGGWCLCGWMNGRENCYFLKTGLVGEDEFK